MYLPSAHDKHPLSPAALQVTQESAHSKQVPLEGVSIYWWEVSHPLQGQSGRGLLAVDLPQRLVSGVVTLTNFIFTSLMPKDSSVDP